MSDNLYCHVGSLYAQTTLLPSAAVKHKLMRYLSPCVNVNFVIPKFPKGRNVCRRSQESAMHTTCMILFWEMVCDGPDLHVQLLIGTASQGWAFWHRPSATGVKNTFFFFVSKMATGWPVPQKSSSLALEMLDQHDQKASHFQWVTAVFVLPNVSHMWLCKSILAITEGLQGKGTCTSNAN